MVIQQPSTASRLLIRSVCTDCIDKQRCLDKQFLPFNSLPLLKSGMINKSRRIRMFEIEATFPQDYLLVIQVWDFDAAKIDQLIGETRIDIENRFYSRHRAHCGIAKVYNTNGYNVWRDRERPSQILESLCRQNNLPLPEYHERQVKIGNWTFPFDVVIERDYKIGRRYLLIENCENARYSEGASRNITIMQH